MNSTFLVILCTISFTFGERTCSEENSFATAADFERRLISMEKQVNSLVEQKRNTIREEIAQTTVSYFTAVADDFYDTEDTPISFANVLSEENSGFDGGSGIVTIQLDGIYYFSTSILQYYKIGTIIYIKHNDNVICSADAEADTLYKMLGCSITINAKKNDRVYVFLEFGRIDGWVRPYSSSFTGFLLTEL